MQIRKAVEKDVLPIAELFKQGKAFLKQNGVVQWNTDYPNEIDARQDVENAEGFVCEENGEVLGYFCYSLRGEATYDVLHSGEWLTQKPYAVVHRVVVGDAARGKGVGAKMYGFTKEKAKAEGVNVRVDTHADNKQMNKLIKSSGFVLCGIATMEDGSFRNAYELDLA